MSVRLSLLAILDQGPCYGYQLRHEFDRRTGSTWPLNVGQIYNTLERLERDGLVARGDVDDQGHVYWRITTEGSSEVATWLTEPVVRAPATRDELAVKLAMAATLPGVDVSAVIAAQREASRDALDALRQRADAEDVSDAPEDLARSLVIASMIYAAEGELRWLDHAEEQLARHPDHAMGLALTDRRPRRGRPARTSTGPDRPAVTL